MSIFDPLWAPLDDLPSKRGGWRQRLAAEEVERMQRDIVLKPSKVVLRHLLDWGRGVCSAIHVWSHIKALSDDGFVHPGVLRILKTASREGDNNTHARLASLLLDLCGLSQYITTCLPGGSTHHMILPSTLFRLLHKGNRRRWQQSFGANPEAVAQFWNRLFSSEMGRQFKADHPLLHSRTASSLSHTLPCLMFEDACPYSKRCSSSALLWGSVLGSGKDLEVRFLHHSEVKLTKK